jgi:PAS domain-containing protein
LSRQKTLEKELGDSCRLLEKKESDLAQVKSELQGLLAASPEAFFLMDTKGGLLYANETTAKLVHADWTGQTAGGNFY